MTDHSEGPRPPIIRGATEPYIAGSVDLDHTGGLTGWMQMLLICAAAVSIFLSGYYIGGKQHPAPVYICCVHGTYTPPSGDHTTVKP